MNPLVLMFVLLATPAWAQPTVRMGIYQNSPKVAVSKVGEPEGIFVDLIQSIAQQEGWRLHYVTGTWAEGLARLGDDRGLAVLTGTLKDPHLPIREGALRALVALGSAGDNALFLGLDDGEVVLLAERVEERAQVSQANLSVAATRPRVFGGSQALWPASGEMMRSASGHARWSAHALKIGQSRWNTASMPRSGFT